MYDVYGWFWLLHIKRIMNTYFDGMVEKKTNMKNDICIKDDQNDHK